MNKKLLVACLAVMAFAVAPSMASANPILTKPTGTVLAAGSAIKATNVGATVMTTSLGNLECSTAIFEGKLTGNGTASGAQGEIEIAKIGGTGPLATPSAEPECTGSGFFTPNTTFTPEVNMPWCLTAFPADALAVKGGPCNQPRVIIFKLDVTGVGTCEYSRATAANGTLVTDGAGVNENTAALTEQAWTLSSGPFGCPSENKLDMRFSLTSGGSTVFISS